MAEPITSASNADDETKPVPNNAEDRKAAAVMDALNAKEMSEQNGETDTKQPSTADQDALGKAMSRLEIVSGETGKKKEDSAKRAEEKKQAEAKKKVKVSSEDVNFLVEELELTKNKATELLRAHDGDSLRAIKAYITPPMRA